MRLWSLHPKHLDSKGLVALWRETLLAKHVLEGKTKGYKNHPQLTRFKVQKDPINQINWYLHEIYKESKNRGYNFDQSKIGQFDCIQSMNVQSGQIEFEREHLLKKLEVRDTERFKETTKTSVMSLHPLFRKTPGGIEEWEIV